MSNDELIKTVKLLLAKVQELEDKFIRYERDTTYEINALNEHIRNLQNN